MLFDANVGGLSASLCREHDLLPLKRPFEDAPVTTLVQRRFDPEKQELLSFILGREIELDALPDDPSVLEAFDDVLNACAAFHSSLGDATYISESADEAIERIERGEQPRCCQLPEPTEKQWQLMDEIRSRYDVFLAAMEQHE